MSPSSNEHNVDAKPWLMHGAEELRPANCQLDKKADFSAVAPA